MGHEQLTETKGAITITEKRTKNCNFKKTHKSVSKSLDWVVKYHNPNYAWASK